VGVEVIAGRCSFDVVECIDRDDRRCGRQWCLVGCDEVYGVRRRLMMRTFSPLAMCSATAS
jgi:hypothetical protein